MSKKIYLSIQEIKAMPIGFTMSAESFDLDLYKIKILKHEFESAGKFKALINEKSIETLYYTENQFYI